MFAYYAALQMPMLTLLFCGLGAYILYQHMTTNRPVFLPLTVAIMAVIIGKLFIFDYGKWAIVFQPYLYKKGTIGVVARFFDYGVVFLYIMSLLQVVSNKTHLVNYRKIFTVTSTSLLFIYASLETNTFFFWYTPSFQEGSVSVVWALFAIAYLIIGITKSSKAWRYTGLTLFVIVVGKVFLIDLADMELFYRVIAFMLLGIILIGGSFAYIKGNKKFKIEEEK
jgi:uncharacterized membrane protein